MTTHVRAHTGGTLKSASATWTTTLDASVTSGNTLLMGTAVDNRSSGLGGGPTVTGISVPGGETAAWALIGREETSAATGSSSVVTEFWAITTTTTWASTFTPVVTISVAVGGHAAVIEEFSNLTTTVRGTVTSSHSTTGAPTGTVASPLNNDLVVGVSGWESAITPTGDSDTTNGSWSSIVSSGTSGGADAANVLAAIQWKIVTADGSQTYNPTGASTDAGIVVATLTPGGGGPPPGESSAVIIGGTKHVMTRNVIIGGAKKTVSSYSIIIGGTKKTIV